MQKVELLAPAGNYESMTGAFAAGADAVYLGGARFGARAYADNFDEEETVRAIRYAHLHGKKIYMTVNTLVKESEYDDLGPFLQPYAEAGLDGVIVQDFGVFGYIREHFPKVELHASTQMAVTGIYGARMLKRMGATRVVPARELSLSEISNIREKADIEVEAFIHGAMCYCYSGMCLFSSIVGGRSGNRGRCAQPCRLPYRMGADEKAGECYPLSLKDMCTVELLPELIRAGTSSFKIEGRMKKPEYVAGVTAIYRKYIDLFLKDPKAQYQVEQKDMDILRSLYLRTAISQGYYHQHNGKNMVTMSAPGYLGSDEALLSEIRSRYLHGEQKIPVTMNCVLRTGKPAEIRLCSGQISAAVQGNPVQQAQKRPMTGEDIVKQLDRFGNSSFVLDHLNLKMDEDGAGIFVPVRELNELRRKACELLEEKILESNEN
ncbi:MAG: U32 family peptidase [Butyrivibrio sp.]|jgi:putative protease|nr:U32 family peptidase [Butyrivibrio sp.]